MTKRTRVFIADEQPIFRLGLHNLLDADPGLQVIGEANGAADAAQSLKSLRVDVLLMNADASRTGTLVALRELARSSPRVRTLLVSGAIERSAILQYLELGARGLVLRDSPSALFPRSVHSVAAGQYWVGRDIVLDLVETLRHQARAEEVESEGSPYRLTARELEIVQCILNGYGNRAIAERFGISEHTVKHHLTRIFDKTGASSRLELAVFALKHFPKSEDQSPARIRA